MQTLPPSVTTVRVSALGNWLRDSRRKAGLEQADVAQGVGVKQQTVSRWENGEAIPRARYVMSIANVLRVDRDELMQLILHEHNEGGAGQYRVDVDLRLDQLEAENAALLREFETLKSEWATVREALRVLLGGE